MHLMHESTWCCNEHQLVCLLAWEFFQGSRGSCSFVLHEVCVAWMMSNRLRETALFCISIEELTSTGWITKQTKVQSLNVYIECLEPGLTVDSQAVCIISDLYFVKFGQSWGWEVHITIWKMVKASIQVRMSSSLTSRHFFETRSLPSRNVWGSWSTAHRFANNKSASSTNLPFVHTYILYWLSPRRLFKDNVIKIFLLQLKNPIYN